VSIPRGPLKHNPRRDGAPKGEPDYIKKQRNVKPGPLPERTLEEAEDYQESQGKPKKDVDDGK
jgi:hypothetical protein